MKTALIFGFTALLFLAFVSGPLPRQHAQYLSAVSPAEKPQNRSFAELVELAKKNSTVHVIVGLRAGFIPEGRLSDSETASQRREIKETQHELLTRHRTNAITNVKLFDYIPFMAFETDAATLEKLKLDYSVVSISEDVVGEAALAESGPIVGADVAWASGFTGAGKTVAILDSGVDKNHLFLAGRVVSEACYSTNNTSSSSFCPGAVSSSTAANSGLNCPSSVSGCDHGTNVAGIATGSGTTFSGVAKGANIIAIQMFSQFTPTACNSASPCARYWTSDLLRALERVRTLAQTDGSIVAVNLSLQTGEQWVGDCDVNHTVTKAAVDNLRSLGIATVACSGNFAFTNALTAPACVSTTISVGATDDGSLGTMLDAVSSFSDSSPRLHLLAPGRWINSSIPGNVFQNYSGTSMAAPHVAGAFAVLKQKQPSATIDRILNTLRATGQPITDSRNGLIKPRIRVGHALAVVGRAVPFDFDGDVKTDIGIFRPSVGEWWLNRSSTGATVAAQFGASTDKPVPADFTGDGKADIAFWRPSTGEWFVLRSEDSSFLSFPFGSSGDMPLTGDFDADGKADPAVFRPSTNEWFVSRSSGGTLIATFGVAGDFPVPRDYDGDGKADIAIYRPSVGEWWINRSSNSTTYAFQFGTATDKVVPGDFTGDGKADAAFYRPSNGNWFVLRSEDSSFFSFPFGAAGDLAVPGDYDGDGRVDPGIFRPTENTWYINRTTSGLLITGFGATGDAPIPNSVVGP